MITIKKPEEIEILAKGGKILAKVLQELKKVAQVGITTRELDSLSEELIKKAGGIPSFKGYGEKNPYPDALCTSVNEEVVHSVPSDRKLKDNDVVGLDIGMQWPEKNGLFTDHAISVPIGNVSKENLDLIDVTKGCLDKVISVLKPGMYVNDIGRIIEKYIKSKGNYGIVRDLVGHGVGYKVHELPKIVNFAVKEKGEEIKEGMVFAIEPMITLGGYEIDVKDNGWDIITKDKSYSAHFEHTIVITKDGCRVLTSI